VSVFLRVLVSVGISALLLGALIFLSDADFAEAWTRLKALPLLVYLGALGIHMCTYCFRALRFRVLIPEEMRPGFRRVVVISAAHNMASYLLPAKTGEASWVVYLRGYCGVRASVGLASLVVARLLDGAVLCSALAMTCLYLSLSGRHSHLDFLGWVGWSLTGLMVLFVLFAWRGDWMMRLVTAAMRSVRLHRWSLGERFIHKLHEVALDLRDASGGGRLFVAALCTLPVWACIFGFYHLLSQALGLSERFTYMETVFGSSLAVMANLLPINGMAGAGTQEGGWTAGFSLLGENPDLALETSLGVHAVQLFNVVALGLLAHVVMGAMPRIVHEDTTDVGRPSTDQAPETKA